MAPLLIEKEGVSIIIHGREHLPPHVHACHGDNEALVNIMTGELVEGYIPPKKLKVVQDWLSQGKQREIVEENFYELNPRLRLLKTEKSTEVKKAATNKKK